MTSNANDAMSSSLFRRRQQPLTHTVYGLILALATVGELIRHETSATSSAQWLLGASAILLAAHLFSSMLAQIAATQDDPTWSELVSIGHEDISVVYGGVGAAVIMAITAATGLDSQNALLLTLVIGLGTLAALSFYGLRHQPPIPRILMTASAIGLATIVVVLENAV